MKPLVLTTERGELHGLMNVVANSVPDNDFKHFSPENKAKLEKLRKEDARMVRARYVNSRTNNGVLEKPYCRYAGDHIQMWRFISGYEYDVPMGLINEVNSKRVIERAEKEQKDGTFSTKDRLVEGEHQFIPTKW